MKNFLVEFRVRRYGCCGSRKDYWVGKKETVLAVDAKSAHDQIIHAWSIDNHVEITKVTEKTQ